MFFPKSAPNMVLFQKKMEKKVFNFSQKKGGGGQPQVKKF